MPRFWCWFSSRIKTKIRVVHVFNQLWACRRPIVFLLDLLVMAHHYYVRKKMHHPQLGIISNSYSMNIDTVRRSRRKLINLESRQKKTSFILVCSDMFIVCFSFHFVFFCSQFKKRVNDCVCKKNFVCSDCLLSSLFIHSLRF